MTEDVYFLILDFFMGITQLSEMGVRGKNATSGLQSGFRAKIKAPMVPGFPSSVSPPEGHVTSAAPLWLQKPAGRGSHEQTGGASQRWGGTQERGLFQTRAADNRICG